MEALVALPSFAFTIHFPAPPRPINPLPPPSPDFRALIHTWIVKNPQGAQFIANKNTGQNSGRVYFTGILLRYLETVRTEWNGRQCDPAKRIPRLHVATYLTERFGRNANAWAVNMQSYLGKRQTQCERKKRKRDDGGEEGDWTPPSSKRQCVALTE